MSTTRSFSDAPQPTRVTLESDPGQLLAAVPHLLGFHPADSVVLIGHRPTEPSVLGWVLRGDLPPEDFESVQAAEMVARLAVSDAFGVTIVVIGSGGVPTTTDGQPPRGSLVDALTEACAASRLRVLHALWTPEVTAGAAWQCYVDTDCAGVVADPGGSAVAAAMAAAGRVTFDSREDLADLLTPDPADDLERRSAALNAALDRFDGCGCDDRGDGCDGGGCGPECADGCSGDRFDTRCSAIGEALTQARAGTLRLTDDQVVRLALALADVRVRDACMALALPAGSSGAVTAEALWIALVRATPGPERAEPAALLGYSAYLRGDGALADIALQTALRAFGEHVLAGLLSRALWKGLTPDRLAGLGRVDGAVDLWRIAERAGDRH